MISEEKIKREIAVLERAVDKMRYPSKTEFYQAINDMKKRLEKEEFEVPKFLRRD